MSARSFTLNKRRQGNITVDRTEVEGQGEQIVITLHRTAIVTKQPSGEIHLNTNGWETSTTKTAMNRAFQLLGVNAGIHQAKGVWYLTYNGEKVAYKDGMTIEKTKLETYLAGE
jgi:hypothetical protein